MRSLTVISRVVTTLLSLSYVLHMCDCLPAYVWRTTSSSTEWKQNGMEAQRFDIESQSRILQPRAKRLTISDTGISEGRKVFQAEDEIYYQSCVTPGNRQGHCKHLGKCIIGEFRTNLARFVEHMCIIENVHVGVCCPDDQEEFRKFSAVAREMFVNLLPTIADEKLGNNITTTDATRKNETTTTTTRTRADGSSKRAWGCGVSAKTRTKLVGGQPADPKEWPWMVALLREEDIQYCGGVLITDRHVLTAAHCVQKHKPREIRVRLGEYDFTRVDETRAHDSIATEIRIHRNFDSSSYENDIAIIKIQRPAMFNTYVWPVCLPPIGQTFENESAIVTGWGTQYYGGPASTVLMEVPVPIWSRERCASSFAQRIPETALCAGAYEGGRDACQGDSGGPLLHRLRNGRWVTVGIVSWGIRCGEPGHPGIYTRVNSYLDWIFANTAF